MVDMKQMQIEELNIHKAKKVLVDLLSLVESHSLAVRNLSTQINTEALKERIKESFERAKKSIDSEDLSFLKFENQRSSSRVGHYSVREVVVSKIKNPNILMEYFFNKEILEFTSLLELFEADHTKILSIRERINTVKARLQKKIDHIEKVNSLEIEDMKLKLGELEIQERKLIESLEEKAVNVEPKNPEDTIEYEVVQRMILELRDFKAEEVVLRDDSRLKKTWMIRRGVFFSIGSVVFLFALFYGKRRINEESERIRRMKIDNEISILLSSPIVTNGINDEAIIEKVKKAESYLDAVNLINKSVLQNSHFTSSLYKSVELRGIVFSLDKANNKVFLKYNKTMPDKIKRLVGGDFSVGAYTVTGSSDSEITFYSTRVEGDIIEGFKIDYLCRAGPLGFLVRVPIKNSKMLEFRFDPRDQTTNLKGWLQNQGFCKISK